MGLKLRFSAMIAKPPVDFMISKAYGLDSIQPRAFFVWCDLVEFLER